MSNKPNLPDQLDTRLLEAAEKITYKDIVVQQSMMFAPTDDLISEVERRLYQSNNQVTGLEKFKTSTIVEELANRIEKLSILYADAREALLIGEAYMSLGNGFLSEGSWERYLVKSTGLSGSSKS